MHAQTGAPSPAFARAQHLRRGINTGMWFAQAPGNYSVDRLRSFTTEADLDLIQRLGLDHIRLSLDAAPLTEWQQGTPTGRAFLAEVDRVVHSANSKGLAVIVDIHPEDSYKQALLHGEVTTDQFAGLWRALAQHFSSTDPEMVFYELMNEPEQTDSAHWQQVQATVASQIRAVDPRHTLIASGAHWSGLQDLLRLEPIPDPNVIYTFHDYEPFPFTHQGATWSMKEVAPLRGVPYPATPANIQAYLSQEPDLLGRYFLQQYAEDHWDASRIDDTVAFAEAWSNLHHVPVYCGEFGVFRRFSDPDSRARWIHDTRVALEHHHLGWAMWDYQTDFGLVTKHNGETTPDPKIVQALGLNSQH